ncbi:MAG: Histidine kinase protein, partial [Thermoproteota archaeon]|nr:Histidine kinase protein [Thermoproteota archaeon]
DVQRAIFESVNLALSFFNYVDKKEFYRILKTQYNMRPEDVAGCYPLFHKALVDVYGVNHATIEREILRLLHERTRTDEYSTRNELSTFKDIVESSLRKSERSKQ